MINLLLGVNLDDSRSLLACVLDVCAPPSLLALSRCNSHLHRALIQALENAEVQSGDILCKFFDSSRERLAVMNVLDFPPRLPAAQCRQLGTWLREGGPLAGVARLENGIQLDALRFGLGISLGLSHRGIFDELMIVLAHTMGSMGKLAYLYLYGNQIGDEGMVAFSAAISSGSLRALESLDLSSNQNGDVGMIEFSRSIPIGSLRALTYLDLEQNQIGDPGMIEFSRSIAIGSLPALALVELDNNPGVSSVQ